MLGCQYKYMDRFYVVVGETFRGIVREPLFLETTAEGQPVARRAARLDGWYLGVRTGRRWRIEPRRAHFPVLTVLLALLSRALPVRSA
jgi:hypothetical protein